MLTTAALLSLQLLAQNGRIDVGAGVRAEVSGGMLPVTPDTPSTGGVETTVIPAAGVRHQSQQSQTSLVYRPRFFARYPNVADLTRPLILHGLDLDSTSSFSAKTDFDFSAFGQAGEVNYTGLRDIFDPGTDTTFQSVTSLGVLGANALLTHQLASRQSFSLGARAGYRSPLGEQDLANQAFIGSLDVSGLGTYSYDLSRRDTLGLALNFTYFWTEDEREAYNTEAQLTYDHRLSESASLSFTGGASYILNARTNTWLLFPTGAVGHERQWRVKNRNWVASSTLGVVGFFDQIATTYTPRATAGYGLSGELGSSWRAQLDLFAATNLTREPELNAVNQTFFGFQSTSGYRLAESLFVDFGLRGNVFGPHLSEFSQGNLIGELVALISISYAEDTAAGSFGQWVQ